MALKVIVNNSRHVLLKARLSVVRRDLHEVMSRLTPDLLDWAPSPRMRTVSGQLVEIVGTEMQLIALLQEGRRISDLAARETIGDCFSLPNLLNTVAETRKRTLDYLDCLGVDALDEEIVFDGGWFGSLGLSAVPRAEIFLNIADHEWYHVGQLTSYLWIRGDDPYSW